MNTDPFTAPGLPIAPESLFSASRRSAAVRPRKVEAPPPVETEPHEGDPAPTEQPAEKTDEVVLSTLAFAKESAGFSETVEISASISLPVKFSHLTRVEFTLMAIGADGKPAAVGKGEGHAKDGQVKAQITLPKADPKSNAKERDFTLKAKHTRSKEAEGGKLKVKADAPVDLEIEVGDAAAAKQGGHCFRLTGQPGDFQKVLRAKDGWENEGKLLLKFENLEPGLKYTLEELDSKGAALGSIFVDSKFGAWSREAAIK